MHLHFKITTGKFKRTLVDTQNKYRIYEKLMGGKDVCLSIIRWDISQSAMHITWLNLIKRITRSVLLIYRKKQRSYDRTGILNKSKAAAGKKHT